MGIASGVHLSWIKTISYEFPQESQPETYACKPVEDLKLLLKTNKQTNKAKQNQNQNLLQINNKDK